jgi:hypothetical protein
MFKKTAIIAGIGLALSATAQADYRWELGASVAGGSLDTEIKDTENSNQKNSEDSTIGAIEGTYFLNPVDTSKGPFGEAAFLDHASSFGLRASAGELDLAGGDDADGEIYEADFRYVAEGPGWNLSGVIVDLGYERAEPGDQEVDRYGMGLGYYLTPTTTAVVDYRKTNVNNGGDVDSWKLDVESFFALSDGGIKVRASGGKTVVSGLDDPSTWLIGATWYMGNNWGFGADLGITDINGYETDTISVNAEWFVTENFAVDLAYRTVQPDDIEFRDLPGGRGDSGKLEVEYDEVAISALYRF